MDAQGLPIVSPKTDFREVDSISAKRLLCFVNHFHAHTVAFLNAFATSCERRLEEVNWRIQKTEATLSVLEAKLSSVPGLDDVRLPTTTSTLIESDMTPSTLPLPELPRSEEGTLPSFDADQSSEISSPKENLDFDAARGVRAADHPAYAKYFRMLHLGVPLQAVALKCRTENPHLDATILETPDRWLAAEDSNADSDEEDDDDDEGWSQ